MCPLQRGKTKESVCLKRKKKMKVLWWTSQKFEGALFLMMNPSFPKINFQSSSLSSKLTSLKMPLWISSRVKRLVVLWIPPQVLLKGSFPKHSRVKKRISALFRKIHPSQLYIWPILLLPSLLCVTFATTAAATHIVIPRRKVDPSNIRGMK